MEITGKWGKCWRYLKNSKSESWNTWLICGCEVHDGGFSEWYLSIDTIDTFAKVSILYRYLFASILPIRRFGQRVHCVWQNKELTPKGEDVNVIPWWKHVLDTIRYYFFTFFFEFLDERFINILHEDFAD